MKKKSGIFTLVLISLLMNIASPLFAEEQVEEKEELPQVMQDLRRFEIISLGSLPFVLLDASLVYSGIKYIQNDFDSQYKPSLNQSNLNTDEQIGVLLTSIGISLGIGITDLIVNIVKRNKAKKREQLRNDPIVIEPISEDPDATELTLPNEDLEKTEDTEVEEFTKTNTAEEQ